MTPNSRKNRYESISPLCEEAEEGLLRSYRKEGSPHVQFHYSDRSFRVKIGAAHRLIGGIAMPRITLDGQSISPTRNFEVVCNHHDHDLDYVELEMPIGEGGTLGRQLILSRDEHFLIIADCVIPPRKSRIEYQCDWPLVKKILGMEEIESREIYLRRKKIQALVMPLALPEWKAEPSSGRLEIVPSTSASPKSCLRLFQVMEGAGLYAPLFFDLSPQRSKKKRTWRRLAVGENLRPVPSDQGVAFRIQSNKQQWFFYRAVASRGNRTFLGQNFQGEFVINRFSKKGKVTELLRIDGESLDA